MGSLSLSHFILNIKEKNVSFIRKKMKIFENDFFKCYKIVPPSINIDSDLHISLDIEHKFSDCKLTRKYQEYISWFITRFTAPWTCFVAMP